VGEHVAPLFVSAPPSTSAKAHSAGRTRSCARHRPAACGSGFSCPACSSVASVALPGVLLEEVTLLPGTVPIGDRRVRPSDAPGLGRAITREWLERKPV
jgi:hypothetical protein